MTSPHSQSQSSVFGLPAEQRERVTAAALVIGLLATAILVGATPLNDFLLMGTYIAGNHFPIGAFSVLLILTLVVNVALRKLAARLALSPGQLIVVWALITVPSGIPSSGMMRYFVPQMISYHYFASPESKWDELFGDEIPSALLIHDEAEVRSFFEGLPPGRSLAWQVWLSPTVIWGIYAFAMYAMMIGLSVMLRRRWVEHERFTFPLVQVPIEIANSPEPGRLVNSFLRNRQVWIAVLILAAIHSLCGLHQFYPAVPAVPLSSDITFRERPLSFAGSLPMTVYPLVIGFAYLLASEVCFSLWFFYLFVKFRAIVLGMFGLPQPGVGAGYGHWLWASLEESGGTIALALWFVWIAKDHFCSMFRKAFVGAPAVQDTDEPLSYRASVFLFLGGTVVMIMWLVHFGGSPFLALANVIIGIAVFITLAWTVAQGGLLFLQPTFATTEILTTLTGSRPWSVSSLLVNMWNEQVFRMDLREYLLPSLLNAHKISDSVNLHRGSLLKSCMVAIVVAFFVSLAAAIWLPYARGGALALPNTWTYIHATRLHFRWAASLSVTPLAFSTRWLTHFGGGFALMLVMMWLRTRISWFAFHPIGFVIASGYPLSRIWFSIFLGWVIKGAIMRWGGYKVYQNLRPFFFGLIVGDCLAGAAWIIVGFITGTGYMLLPG